MPNRNWEATFIYWIWNMFKIASSSDDNVIRKYGGDQNHYTGDLFGYPGLFRDVVYSHHHVLSKSYYTCSNNACKTAYAYRLKWWH
jgi:hypothetical protein